MYYAIGFSEMQKEKLGCFHFQVTLYPHSPVHIECGSYSTGKQGPQHYALP